jgi:N-acyl-D-aspartate/D-glutamate deacylase
LACGIILALGLTACQPEISADYIIENGQVFLGDNTPPNNYVVAVKGENIVYVGKPVPINANYKINAKGHFVAPGFIDPHTHSLSELTSEDAEMRANTNYLFQGVTTVFNGNDGYGHPDIAEQINALNEAGIGTNTALFIGHGALRQSVMGGDKRPPNQDEMRDMKQIVTEGLEAGAIGLSTGLFYAPGSFSKTDEVVELAKIVSNYGGVYDSHIRDEATYNIGLEAAVDEVITIAREADVPANIAHIKALGVDVWGKSEALIKKIEDAQAEGLKITADQYPWQASGTRISNALLPRWAKAGSHEDYMQQLSNPSLRETIKKETAENLRKRGGPDAVLITGSNPDWQGKTLTEVSNSNNVSPVDMAIVIAQQGDARIASFNMNMDDIENFMRQDWVMTSSDGSTGHPRKYASYPKKYRDYVIGKGLMPVETFFYRSSGLVADSFNLCDRGYLRKGYKADIAIINPEMFSPVADFQNPAKLGEGVEYLFVNGQDIISSHRLKPILPGKVIKRCATRN